MLSPSFRDLHNNQLSGIPPSAVNLCLSTAVTCNFGGNSISPFNLSAALLALPMNTTSMSPPDSQWGIPFIGTLPSLAAYTALTSLTFNDHLTGTIPSSLAGALRAPLALRLLLRADSSGRRARPTALTALQSLNLHSNSLTSTIPDLFANMTALTFLDLSNNQLNGTLPGSVTSLQSIQCFNVGSNNLNGTLSAAQVAFLGQVYANSWLYLSTCGSSNPYLSQSSSYALLPPPASASPPAPTTSALQTQVTALNTLVAAQNSLIAALQVNLTAGQAACAAAG